ESGITIIRLDEGLDTGPILASRAIALDGEDRTPELTARLAELGADLLSETLHRLELGEDVPAEPQEESNATLCRPIEKSDGRIDWSLPAEALDRRLRAFDPWPGVFTHLEEERLKILDAKIQPAGATGG